MTDAWLDLRTKRDALLSASDWCILPDSPFEKWQQVEWQMYRKALRDLPANTTDPANPVWPIPPGT